MKFAISLKDYIFMAIIAILLLIVVFHKNNPSPASVLQKHTQDSLKTEIVKKMDSIAMYDKHVKSLQDSIYVIQSKINTNDTKIKTVHEAYERQVLVVNDWSVIELNDFFSKRYNTDSTK